jgi:hypothetical protein
MSFWFLTMLKLKLIYDWQSVSQSVLVSGAHLGPATNFSFSLKFPSDICGFIILFIILWRPLWQEVGSVIYCTIASGPCQSSHSWVEVPQNSTAIFYCLIWDSPNLEGQVPIFISPRNSNNVSIQHIEVIFCLVCILCMSECAYRFPCCLLWMTIKKVRIHWQEKSITFFE